MPPVAIAPCDPRYPKTVPDPRRDRRFSEHAMKGKCLCGRVSWKAKGMPNAVHHCHCSMCRRWTGSAFATLVWFKRDAVTWPTMMPKVFRSSPIALRSHCDNCGTPIYLAYDARDDIALAAGSAEHPEQLTPTHHYGIESRLPWADLTSNMPARATKEAW
jgi:hypothetical protein